MKEMLGQYRAVNVIFYDKEKQHGFHRWWQVLAEHICHEGQFKQSIQMVIKEKQKWSNTQTQGPGLAWNWPSTLAEARWAMAVNDAWVDSASGPFSSDTTQVYDFRKHTYTTDTTYKTDNRENLLHSTGSSMHRDELSGKKIRKAGHLCICMVESFSCTVGENSVLKQLYANKN